MAEQYRLYGRSYSTKLKQAITEPSATRHYEYGTLLEDTLGNKYRYAKTEEATCLTQRGAWDSNYQISGHLVVPTTSAIATKTVYATVTSGDGIGADGAIAADYLKDGYAIVWHADLTIMRLRIISNTVVAAPGGLLTLTVEDPINAAITAGVETIEINANKFKAVKTGNSNGLHVFVGQWMSPVTTAKPYGWVLRKGETFIDPQASVGLTNHARVGFRHDGSIDLYVDSSHFTDHMQPAGYVVSYLAAGTQAAPFIMLDLE